MKHGDSEQNVQNISSHAPNWFRPTLTCVDVVPTVGADDNSSRQLMTSVATTWFLLQCEVVVVVVFRGVCVGGGWGGGEYLMVMNRPPVASVASYRYKLFYY